MEQLTQEQHKMVADIIYEELDKQKEKRKEECKKADREYTPIENALDNMALSVLKRL